MSGQRNVSQIEKEKFPSYERVIYDPLTVGEYIKREYNIVASGMWCDRIRIANLLIW